MLLGYLALSMIIALVVAATAVMSGTSLIMAFFLYAATGALCVMAFAALIAFREHDPVDDPVSKGLTPAE